MPPWAEYAMLTLLALSGGNWLDNLVQWFAMVGSVIGVSLIAKLLGANSRCQLLAGLMCVQRYGVRPHFAVCFAFFGRPRPPAFPAFRAISLRCSGVSFSIRPFTESFPSATAAAFFFAIPL